MAVEDRSWPESGRLADTIRLGPRFLLRSRQNPSWLDASGAGLRTGRSAVAAGHVMCLPPVGGTANDRERQAAVLTSSSLALVSFLPTVRIAASWGRNLRFGRALPLSQL